MIDEYLDRVPVSPEEEPGDRRFPVLDRWITVGILAVATSVGIAKAPDVIEHYNQVVEHNIGDATYKMVTTYDRADDRS